jgi:hypothetical protein
MPRSDYRLSSFLAYYGRRSSLPSILPLSIASKAATATILVIISEVLFWVGILLTGKEFAHRFRRQLHPYYWWQRFTRRR